MWRNGARDIVVAVKLLKKGANEIDKVKFLQEAAIMAQFKHPNVVSLYGVVSKTEPVSLHLNIIVHLSVTVLSFNPSIIL